MKKRFFNKNFLWGAAVAAHQVEGGNEYNQWTIWERDNAERLAKKAEKRLSNLDSWPIIKNQAQNPENYISGKAVDHFDLYKEDFSLLEELHFNAFRFSVEWSRVEPREGEFDYKAIEYYRKYIAELKKRNIEPVVTLFHFTLPNWFVEKGGFEKLRNSKYFVRFTRKIMSELRGDVRYIITINEPEIYASSVYQHKKWPALRHGVLRTFGIMLCLAYSHKKVYKALRKIDSRFLISISKNSVYYYAGDDALLSRLGAKIYRFFQDYLVIGMFIRHCDFLGVNYYFSNRVDKFHINNSNQLSSDLGYDMDPADIQFVLQSLYKKYHKPIFITENGLADSQDQYRQWWIEQTVAGMRVAILSGVKLIGYLHWSLLDNFEWSYGKWPRFGLVEVSYRTMKRKLRPSAIWFGEFVKKTRGLK